MLLTVTIDNHNVQLVFWPIDDAWISLGMPTGPSDVSHWHYPRCARAMYSYGYDMESDRKGGKTIIVPYWSP
jgi:hypothetical protein